MPDQYREPIEGDQSVQETPPATAAVNPVEQEILELERQLIEKRAEQKKSVEAAIGFEQPQPTGQTVTPLPTSAVGPVQPTEVKADTEKFKGVEKNQQLKGLVDLSFAKGLSHATKVVRNLDNPYLMDEFHDTLIDEFHKKLVDEGKLEEI